METKDTYTTLIEKWNSFSFGKKVMCVIGGIFLTAIVYVTLMTFSQTMLGVGQGESFSGSSIPTLSMPSSYGYGTVNSNAQYSVASDSYGETRSYAPSPSYSGVSIKSEAEKYELSSYTASIKTRTIDEDCAKIQSLKSDTSVIFLYATTGKTYCNFSFKVEKAGVQKVLDTIQSMDPDALSENVRTIAQTLTNYERRKQTLENQVISIDKTLNDAIRSYEELSSLAVKSKDAQSLAIAINNKIDIIDRLVSKKLSIEEQLQAISNTSSDDMKETLFAHFSVSLTEDTYIDTEAILTSWKYETKKLLSQINNSLQDLTLGFFSVLLTLLKYTLYFLVLVAFLKYVKRAVLWIWNR